MIRKMHPTQEVYTTCDRLDKAFVWMQRELKMCFEKIIHLQKQSSYDITIVRTYDKVIGISDVVFDFKIMLDVLIKLVHVDIDQELGGEVTERETHIIKV